jgi:hypothetical protein
MILKEKDFFEMCDRMKNEDMEFLVASRLITHAPIRRRIFDENHS